MNNILTQIKENCELRNLSENTQRSYLRIARQYCDFFDTSPDELGTDEIKKYLLHLLRDKKQSAQTLDVVYAALKFLYHNVLNRPLDMYPVPRARQDKKLPVILSTEEVSALLSVIKNINW